MFLCIRHTFKQNKLQRNHIIQKIIDHMFQSKFNFERINIHKAMSFQRCHGN